MKLNYFNQALPDEDDRLLRLAIDEGSVPPTCLLGGPIIEQAVREGQNPCHTCQGPRERCGGAPRASQLASSAGATASGTYTDVRRLHNDSANARKAFRQSQTNELLRLLKLT